MQNHTGLYKMSILDLYNAIFWYYNHEILTSTTCQWKTNSLKPDPEIQKRGVSVQRE